MSNDPETTGESLNKEIERKFLITHVPSEIFDTLQGTKIDQGYLAVDNNAAVRIRRKGPKYFITYKQASTTHAAERVELETELTEGQFTTLWPGTEGRRVEKTRYKFPYGSHTVELDIFEGDNAGRMLAEVEFNSTYEADAFVPPEWFGTDVTADMRYANSSIADSGFPIE